MEFDSETRPAVTETASLLGYALAFCAWVALRCDSFACFLDRRAHEAARSSGRAQSS